MDGCNGYGRNCHWRLELRKLPDRELARRRDLAAEQIRRLLAPPEAFLAFASLKNWQGFARSNPDAAARLAEAESELADLEAEEARRARMPC